jgi:hypothetical protein
MSGLRGAGPETTSGDNSIVTAESCRETLNELRALHSILTELFSQFTGLEGLKILREEDNLLDLHYSLFRTSSIVERKLAETADQGSLVKDSSVGSVKSLLCDAVRVYQCMLTRFHEFQDLHDTPFDVEEKILATAEENALPSSDNIPENPEAVQRIATAFLCIPIESLYFHRSCVNSYTIDGDEFIIPNQNLARILKNAPHERMLKTATDAKQVLENVITKTEEALRITAEEQKADKE